MCRSFRASGQDVAGSSIGDKAHYVAGRDTLSIRGLLRRRPVKNFVFKVFALKA